MFIKEYFNLVFTAKNFDDAAFPQTIDHEEGTILVKGLTKREYFAAMAMQGYISCGKFNQVSDETLAMCSVQQADALIKALNEIQP